MWKMRIRRYYKKGIPYRYTISDKFLETLKSEYGEMRAAHIDNASYELILESEEEEKQWFNDCCYRVLANVRWYLDNLDKLPTFTVKWRRIFPKKIK